MRYINFFLLALLSTSSHALATKWDSCFEDASKKVGVDVRILKAIALQESSMNPRVINASNSNGTEDVGLMQINSIHFPLLETAGVSRRDLFNACVNIHVGALILRDCIRIHGNTWEAVGAYNVGHRKGVKFDRLRKSYATKIWYRYHQVKG